MKKNDVFSVVSLLAAPAVVMVLGGVLLLRPDSASVLIGRVLGWAVLLAGVGFGVSAISAAGSNTGRLVAAIICIGFGGWLVRNPLALSVFVGRAAGILLLIQGCRDLAYGGQEKRKTWGIAAALAGLILTVLPRTASRLVLSLCGLALLAAGVVMLLDRLRRRRLERGDDGDSNIIDAL